MNKPSKNPVPKDAAFSSKDRKNAIDIEKVDMFVYNEKNKFTGDIKTSERFMIIKAKNGKRYVFREYAEVDNTGLIK